MANRSMQRVLRLTCFQNFKSRPANHQVMMVTSDAESARDIPIHYSWMQNRMICTQKCKFHSWRIHASWLPLAHREICNPSPQTSALLLLLPFLPSFRGDPSSSNGAKFNASNRYRRASRSAVLSFCRPSDFDVMMK